MKKTIGILILAITVLSCAAVDVSVDYNKDIKFNQYKTYAFYKPGIDKAKISDLDKKRILRAIDFEMSQKGMVKSSNPDVLISIFTQAREEVNIVQNNNLWGWGWNTGFNTVNTFSTIEGKLFIDFIDASKNELIWQGLGESDLSQDVEKKQENIKEIVSEIMKEYPPAEDKS